MSFWTSFSHFTSVFQVILHYPSGRKSVIVKEGTHQQICKTIVRGGNTDSVVADILCKSNPTEIVRGSQKIVREESKNISKRGSETALQKKSYEHFFSFQWEQLHQNLQEMCPGLLSIITSTVSDVPPTVGSKPFFFTYCKLQAMHFMEEARRCHYCSS